MFQGLPTHRAQQGAGSCIITILPLVLHDVICVLCVASQVCCICAGHLQHHHAHHQQSAGHAACAGALYSSRASKQQRLHAGRTAPQHLQHGMGGGALMQTSPSAFIRSSLTNHFEKRWAPVQRRPSAVGSSVHVDTRCPTNHCMSPAHSQRCITTKRGCKTSRTGP
jgi:hypothetical protein